jgi:sterol desaturase/sphingolipid hydroxylase (fatty acid hydroxylase superfamily)
MSFESLVVSAAPTVILILIAMGIVALVEAAIPLHARGRWHRAHLGPNLSLTLLTFATNAFLSAGLLAALLWLHGAGFGLLHLFALPPALEVVLAVVGLDLSFYVAHRAMHQVPAFWRFHRVHHSDPAVDVTTTIRQHPGESLIRYVFMGACAVALGPSPGAFALYRLAVALNGLLEHANLRAPLWLDGALSLVTTWPHMHKIHHSRRREETDTNYGNLLSLWDRLFWTFTPSSRGTRIAYGLDGLDDPATQTTAGLLALPFRARRKGTLVRGSLPGGLQPGGSRLASCRNAAGSIVNAGKSADDLLGADPAPRELAS